MRALRWPDAFLGNDLVVLKALAKRGRRDSAARERVLATRRAYAVMHLWRNAQ
jgi:3-methyladenine DNA glycosylase/8-oxoguanine DNA glycosylase